MKNKIFYTGYTIFIIICALLFASCYTTYHYQDNISPKKDTLVSNSSYIIMKNGTYIKTEDYDLKYYNKYNERTNIYFARSKYTPEDVIIPADSIKEMFVKEEKFDTGKTTVVSLISIVGATALVLLGFIVVFIAGGGID